MSFGAIIRLGPLVSAEAMLDPSSVRAGRSLYQRGGMTLIRTGAPVLVDHDDDQVVGAVEELWEWTENTGGWLVARCRIDEPTTWLKQGTAASIGYAPLGRPQRIGGWERVHRGLVTEISILSPGVEPADGAAKVLRLERHQASSAAEGSTSGLAAAGEIHLPRGTVIIRPGGSILGVR